LVSGFLDWPIGRHFKITGGISRGKRSSTRLYQDYEFFQQQFEIVGTSVTPARKNIVSVRCAWPHTMSCAVCI
jgi:hypothetical protein